MIIVRMETQAGAGAYRAKVQWPEGLYPGDIDRHPNPMNDRGLRGWWARLSYRVADKYHFAFKDPTQAKAWFYSDGHVKAMKEAGVGVGIYLVGDEHTKEGWAQVVFIKSESRRLAWYEDIEEGFAAFAKHAEIEGSEVPQPGTEVATDLGDHPAPEYVQPGSHLVLARFRLEPAILYGGLANV